MLSDEIRREILARPNLKAKTKGERLYFRCPRHEDNTPSAWMAGGAWGCFSCGFEESITTLAEHVGILLDGADAGYTLEDYADAKGFSVSTLRAWGLETVESKGSPVVRIPYYDEEGNELRARFRSRTGKWWEGRNRPIYLYGRDKLVDAKQGDRVLVVEGESDCHALWSEGVLAVGVPGATSWRPEWSECLKGLEVYVWEEPDQGGAQMVEKLVESFPDARIVRPDGAKDAAELRQKLGQGFVQAVGDMMRSARPYGAPEPPVAFDVLGPERFERLLEHQLAPIDAVGTPFPAWGKACRDEGGGIGMARGWHVLGAARTGHGKSILALNVAAAAMRSGESVCFISLEMSQRQVETRLMSIVSGEKIRGLEKGQGFDEVSFRRAALAFGQIRGRFMTNRTPISKLDEVTRSIRAMYEIHGARFFIVDYIQLAANQNDADTITAASQAVREAARELQVITFGLSQFNRNTAGLNETPTVHGLTGGSSLENDSDQILLIDHSKFAEATHLGHRIGWTTQVCLAKNRHGPTVDIPIHFSTETLRMRELMPDEMPAHLRLEA